MGFDRISAVVSAGRDVLDLNCGGEEEGRVHRAGFLARCQGYAASESDCHILASSHSVVGALLQLSHNYTIVEQQRTSGTAQA